MQGKRKVTESDDIKKRFEFRTILPEETDQAIAIERICFPPAEACSPENMTRRIRAASDFFLVAVDRKTGKIAGYFNGLATDEETLRDDFFTDASLHDPSGRVVMLAGLAVLPQYRGKGLARELAAQYRKRARKDGRRMLVLTCVPEKVGMYQKFGYEDRGISQSSWGGRQWHEMVCVLNSQADFA